MPNDFGEDCSVVMWLVDSDISCINSFNLVYFILNK
jgi:hypothetical protein